MPAPVALAPIAFAALRWAAIGAVAYAAARAVRRGEARPMHEESALDAAPEGAEVSWSRDAGRARGDASGRLARTIRLGRDGPGVEIDFAGHARLRLRGVSARGRGARR